MVNITTDKVKIYCQFSHHKQYPYGTQTLTFAINSLSMESDTELIRFNNSIGGELFYSYVDDLYFNGEQANMSNVDTLFKETCFSQPQTSDEGVINALKDIKDAIIEKDIDAIVEKVKEDINVPTKVSELENDANYLTEHQKIKTVNNQSLIGEGNITITGASGNYLPLSGGTLTGKIQIGDYTSNIANAILHIRNVASPITGAKVNGACYSVNSDGTASLQHKTYNDSGGGAKNAAVLRMSNQGLQFAVNTGSTASPTEDMYKEIATQEWVLGLINDLKQQLGI